MTINSALNCVICHFHANRQKYLNCLNKVRVASNCILNVVVMCSFEGQDL